MFYGKDLYNLQILCTDQTAPSEEQLASLHRLLKYFQEANYNMAILRSRGDQYKRKLEEIAIGYQSIRNCINHVESEYKEETFNEN